MSGTTGRTLPPPVKTVRLTPEEINARAARFLERAGSTLPVRPAASPTLPSASRNLYMPAILQTHFHLLVALPGKALAVYIVLRLRSRLERSPTVALTNERLKYHGISPKEKRVALRHLETAELITVQRRSGKNPLITLR